jgi:hypothetical protein
MSASFYVYGGNNTSLTSFSTDTGNGINTYELWEGVALPACSLSKLGAQVKNGSTSGTHIKIALYNSAGNLVTGSSGTISPPSLASFTWEEVSITPINLTAGIYYIACQFSSASLDIASQVNPVNPVNGWYASATYANFPPSSLPSGTGGSQIALGVYITVPHDYSTLFPATENPISESGNWTNCTAGSTNLATSGGFCYGINSPPGNVNDEVATLTNGLWPVTQFVQAQVSIPGATYTADYPEVELHLMMTNTPSAYSGYEISFSVGQGASSYMLIVRLNGLSASPGFTTLSNPTGNAEYGVVDGDVITAWIDSSNYIYAVKNSVLIASVQDTGSGGYGPWTSGQPGLGFNYAPSSGSGTGAHTAYGVSSFLAVSAASIFSRRGFGPKIGSRQEINF